MKIGRASARRNSALRLLIIMVGKVFISYSHDSREHARRVLDLSDRLRRGGVDCTIDQYEESPREGWSRWMMNQIEQAEFVLVVCTESYERRFRGKEEAGKGLGARWEGAIITEEIYQNEANNTKFIPLLFSVGDAVHIPVMLRSATYYDLGSEEGYEKLYRRLTRQPQITPPSLGKIIPMPSDQPQEPGVGSTTHQGQEVSRTVPMPPLERKQDFGAPHEPPPLSAGVYALIALAGLAIGIGLLFFYVYQVPKLIESGVQNQIFYLLLIPWALACAAFLFGAMKSYARFTHQHLGSYLELGGPVVLFCLVMTGGFKLVPAAPATFDLTVRPRSADGRDPIIISGKITIDLDTDRRTEAIGSNGEADFKGVPPRFQGATLKILPQVEGYEKQWQRHKLHGNVLELPLVRPTSPMTRLAGSIEPPPANWKELRVTVDGQTNEGKVDKLGRFVLDVNGKDGERVRLKIYAARPANTTSATAEGQEIVYDDFQVPPGPVTLKLHTPR